MERSKNRIARESHSLPSKDVKLNPHISLEEDSETAPLLRQNNQSSNNPNPNNTIGQMLNVSQAPTAIYKPSTPKAEPSTLPITNEVPKQSNFTPIKPDQPQ